MYFNLNFHSKQLSHDFLYSAKYCSFKRTLEKIFGIKLKFFELLLDNFLLDKQYFLYLIPKQNQMIHGSSL